MLTDVRFFITLRSRTVNSMFKKSFILEAKRENRKQKTFFLLRSKTGKGSKNKTCWCKTNLKKNYPFCSLNLKQKTGSKKAEKYFYFFRGQRRNACETDLVLLQIKTFLKLNLCTLVWSVELRPVLPLSW